MIELDGVRRAYPVGEEPLLALNGVTVQIAAGEYVAVMGPSGDFQGHGDNCPHGEPSAPAVW